MRGFRILAGLLVAVGLVGAFVIASPAHATPQCPGVGNDCSQDTTVQGGQGGHGGAGGTAISAPVTTIINAPSVKAEGGKGGDATAGAVAGSKSKSKADSKSKSQAEANAPTTIEGDRVEVPASAPSVFTGSLVASPETCLGSFQAGGSGSNGLISLGLTFGKTYVDPDCTRRMYARSLMLLGGEYNKAAMALLAQDENVAKALRAAGVAIPGQAAVIPDLKLNTPLGEPKSEEPKSDLDKRTSLDVPAAMAATQAARLAAVQGN